MYVTGSVKTLHISMQSLTHFRTLNSHNYLAIPRNVDEIHLLRRLQIIQLCIDEIFRIL